MKKYIIIFLMAFLCQYANAQVIGEVNVLDRDIFYLQYTPPNVISEDFTYQRWSTKLSIPPIRFNKLSLFNTVGMDVHQFAYSNDKNDSLAKRIGGTDNFYNINYSLFINYKLSEKWSLNALATPFLLSNFEGKLTSKDFNFNGNLYAERTFFRKRGGYFQVGLGVGQMTLNGNTQVTPIAHIKARLNESWSFVVGLPNTYVKWDLNQKHSLKALMDINDFSANLSGNNLLVNSEAIDNAVFTTVAAGLEYNYWIKPTIGVMLRATQPIWSDYTIKDSSGQGFYNFDTSFEQPFISVGIKFNPIRNLQNNLFPL